MSVRKAKIGLIQVDLSAGGSIRERWDKLTVLAENCLDNGADLAFFPEAYQYTNDRRIINNPDGLTACAGEWKRKCSALAKKYGAYVAPWDYEICGGNIYNTSYILDRKGMEIGRFRKVHLTYDEIMWGLTNGEDFPVFGLDIGKVGIMICFDNYFPESARILGNRGAELVLYPMYGDTLIPQWELKMRTRAVDNSMYIASCQIGGRLDIAYTGAVNPYGEVIARIDTYDTWRVVEIEMGRQVVTHTTGTAEYKEDIRRYLEKTRNPAAYKGLLEKPEDTLSWDEIFFGEPPK